MRWIKILFSCQTLLCVLWIETFELSTLNLDTKVTHRTGLIHPWCSIRDQNSPSSPSSLRPKPSILNPTSSSLQHVHKHPGSTAFCSDYSIPKPAFAWVWTQGKLMGPQGVSALYAVSLCLLWLWTNPWTKASTSTNNDYKALEFTIPCSSGLGKGWISNVFGRYITWRDNAMEAVRFAVSISLEYFSMPQLSRIRLRNVPRVTYFS